MTNYDRVVRAMSYAKGDNLERAKIAFRGRTDAEMQKQYGQSGETCAHILAEYEQDRKDWQEAMDWLEKLKDRI